MSNARKITELYQALRPLILRDVSLAKAEGSRAAGGMELHDLGGAWHTGTLAEAQAPWAATKNEWATALASHAALPDVHHAAVTAGTLISLSGQQVNLAPGSAQYQIPLTGPGPFTPSWVGLAGVVGTALNFASGKINVDGSIAGAGLTWSGGAVTYATITQRGTATSAAGAGTPASYQTITQRGATTTATGAGTAGGYNTITQRGSAASANSYTNSLSVTRPTGVVENDVLVAIVTWWAQTLTAPSGWTQIGDTLSWSHPDGTVYARAYYRVAGASEPSSYAWALNAANDIAATIVAYSNVDTTDPIAANGGQTQTSASMTAPSVNAATAADMLLFLGAVGDTNAGTLTATPPSGMTELADTTSGTTWIKSYAAHQLLAASGATGTRTATVSASARNAAFLVSLRPTSQPASNTSVTVNAPSGLTADDVLLATVAYAGGTLTPPTGWTQILSQAGTGVTLAVYRKIAVSEPGSYTWSLNSTDGLAVALSAYDNVDLTAPVGAYASQANSSSTSMVAPTITPATTADMLYFAGAVAGNVRATVPAGMTEEADAGTTGVGVYGADELLSSGSATGTRTATLASAAANAAALISLRPVAVEEIDTSVSVSLPTGTTTDDVLVAVVAYVSGTLTPPSGWTQVLSQAYTGGTVRVYRRTATGSEPSTYVWALDSAAALAVAVAAYDGVDLSTPVDASASQANASGTSLTAPTVTTTRDTCLLLFAGGVAGNVRATVPSGMTEEADAGTTGVGVYLADESLSASGATGTRTATLASAAANAGALVALRPAATSSGGGGVINVAVSGLGLSVGDDVITLTSSSNPGAAASILASDASGYLTLVRLSTSDRLRSPILDTAAGNLTIQPAADIVLNPAGGEVRLAANRALQSDNYASQTTGMRVTHAGEGDFRYLFADELHAKSFIADLEQALAGGQIISKSVAVLASAFTAPAAGGTATLVVRDLPSAPDMACFVSGDIVRLRQFSRAAGSLTIADCWGVVTGYADGTGANEGTQTWTFTRSAAPNAGAMAAGTVIAADAIVLDYGTSGNGFYEVNAVDGAYGLNSPYAQIVSWTTHPATGQTVRSRLGNLRGIFGAANEYGLYAGAGTSVNDAYLRISNTEVGLYNLPLRMYLGGTERVHIAAHNDVWIGPSSADKRLSWDGSTLTINGSINVTGGNAATTTYADSVAGTAQTNAANYTNTVASGKANVNLDNSVISTLISGANIRVGSGVKDSTLNGWNIDATEIVGQVAGVDQVVMNATGTIMAGAGTTKMGRNGIYVQYSSDSPVFTWPQQQGGIHVFGDVSAETNPISALIVAEPPRVYGAWAPRIRSWMWRINHDASYVPPAGPPTQYYTPPDDALLLIYNDAEYRIWHSGNDGTGSGLDADLLDGYHASSFALLNSSPSFSGMISAPNLAITYGGGGGGITLYDRDNDGQHWVLYHQSAILRAWNPSYGDVLQLHYDGNVYIPNRLRVGNTNDLFGARIQTDGNMHAQGAVTGESYLQVRANTIPVAASGWVRIAMRASDNALVAIMPSGAVRVLASN